jgi:capsular polysaccharide biosynthesis protein
MSSLKITLRARLRSTWYRIKRAGYRAQIWRERLKRKLPGRAPKPQDGPLDPPRYAQASAQRCPDRVVIFAPQKLLRQTAPLTVDDEIHPHFQFDLEHTVPELSVCRLPKGRVWGPTGAVITDDNVLLDDLSIAWHQEQKSKSQHPIFSNWRYHPVHRLSGTVAVLTTDGADLYYHWLFQLLPRIDLLERAGFGPDRIDHYVVNRAIHPYELDSLQRLGIRAEQIVETRVHPHVQAETLLAPSIPLHGSQFSKPLVDFVRTRLAGLPPAAECKRGQRRIYLTRHGAAYRHVFNEVQVRERVQARGFELVAPEELTFAEQIQLMTEAGVVLGPHGGGMSNTVFCAPGTRVGEIFAEEYVAPWFWFLASMTQVEYHYMIAAAKPRIERAKRWDSGAGMQVDLPKLERFLDRLLS